MEQAIGYVCLLSSALVSLGGPLGRFHHSPPPGYAGIHESVEGNRQVKLQPFLHLGTSEDLLVSGPAVEEDHETFVPAPIDTSKVCEPLWSMYATGSAHMRKMISPRLPSSSHSPLPLPLSFPLPLPLFPPSPPPFPSSLSPSLSPSFLSPSSFPPSSPSLSSSFFPSPSSFLPTFLR